MKKIIASTLLLFFVGMSSFSQTFDFEAESTQANLSLTNPDFVSPLTNPFQDEDVKTFRENSIGLMFMPIPLFIDTISINNFDFSSDENIFKSGYGATINVDFNASGVGFGMFAYLAIIPGDDLDASDYFVALKYDIRLGGIDSNFELSPLLGVGSLRFNVEEGNIGSSLYASGGARITYRISNRLFLGADVITVPFIFNPEELLGLDNGEEASIDYKFIAQFNLSLRYNIFY